MTIVVVEGLGAIERLKLFNLYQDACPPKVVEGLGAIERLKPIFMRKVNDASLQL